MRFFYWNSSLERINFSFKGEKKKAVIIKEPYEGKGLSADEVVLTGFEKYHLSTAWSILLTRRKKRKILLPAVPVCLLSAVCPALSTARLLKTK